MADFPTVLEIQALAEDYGYSERRPEASCTLFFREDAPANPNAPILINVFYTTRGIMTQLPHPTQGYNSLWRSSAYDSLEALAMLFEDPRAHTGRGFRQAKNAVRGCASCGDQKKRTEYSANQWKAGPGKSVCTECVTSKKKGGGGDKGGKENKNNIADEGGDYPRLSADALKEHDKQQSNALAKGKKGKQRMERRQYNCPLCPTEGRGKNVFFKKVPSHKPIVKCPKCKRSRQGKCDRLYPIPRGEEKGYGLFKCGECQNKWGSSRAIGNVGQQCHVCELAGNTAGKWVKPFRMEVVKNKGRGISGGGARPAGRGMRRQPRESIPEDAEAPSEYTPSDRNRATGGGGGGGAGFDWVKVEEADGGQEAAPAASRLSAYKSAAQHKCEGCATGACRSRKLPISGIHDVRDGDTVSTSGSIVTNSEVDKSEFVDRDIDFADWEEEDDTEVWVTMGANGKMLRG
ncbi:hypothetical protein ACHAXT_007590 [Thalassiosira profunda]